MFLIQILTLFTLLYSITSLTFISDSKIDVFMSANIAESDAALNSEGVVRIILCRKIRHRRAKTRGAQL